MQWPQVMLLAGIMVALAGAGMVALASYEQSLADAQEWECRTERDGLDELECMQFAGIGAGIEKAWGGLLIGVGAFVASVAGVGHLVRSRKSGSA